MAGAWTFCNKDGKEKVTISGSKLTSAFDTGRKQSGILIFYLVESCPFYHASPVWMGVACIKII